MAIIEELNGKNPVIGERCFLAENAVIVGDVVIGKDCSIWYGAVLRGDVNPIIIGDRVNIQDGAVLHTTHKLSVVEIGNNVSIGHNAIVHGAKIGNNVLIGMGAILMDNSVIPDNTIIAAGALVLTGSVLEPGVYAGIPAKKIKESSVTVTEAAIKNAEGYLDYMKWYIKD
ncbi:MAG: gamma carbonic anhydrase family protein [Bacteroidales bacterium]|nr:gamma carbonic anhydrase family protein [Bacteroidales bacterium]MDD3990250.1 gamma carbonic anhydrase family protein [Bacteroidales bacterium]MDD4639008.1 gamma carbonic anhydrase family protein [Bacteroidales bacterium]